jgi:hypothetical protein
MYVPNNGLLPENPFVELCLLLSEWAFEPEELQRCGVSEKEFRLILQRLRALLVEIGYVVV